jgi:putative thioredoxin
LFVDGRVADEFTGVLPEPQLRDFLLGALPSPARSWVASAKARMAAGDAEGALVDLDRALAVDPASEDGALTRIEALLERDRLADAAAAAAALESRPVRDEARLAALKARLAFGSRIGVDIDELGRRAAATPVDCAAKIDYAKALAARGDYERALEALLAVVRIDRRFGDDAARKTMLAIFDVLGIDSDLARRYRRELAAAINR